MLPPNRAASSWNEGTLIPASRGFRAVHLRVCTRDKCTRYVGDAVLRILAGLAVHFLRLGGLAEALGGRPPTVSPGCRDSVGRRSTPAGAVGDAANSRSCHLRLRPQCRSSPATLPRPQPRGTPCLVPPYPLHHLPAEPGCPRLCPRLCPRVGPDSSSPSPVMVPSLSPAPRSSQLLLHKYLSGKSEEPAQTVTLSLTRPPCRSLRRCVAGPPGPAPAARSRPQLGRPVPGPHAVHLRGRSGWVPSAARAVPLLARGARPASRERPPLGENASTPAC